jgi:hypothetical protein
MNSVFLGHLYEKPTSRQLNAGNFLEADFSDIKPLFRVTDSRQLTGNIWHRVFRCGISRTCERLDVNYLPVLASGFENRDWSICLFCST